MIKEDDSVLMKTVRAGKLDVVVEEEHRVRDS